MQSLTTDSLKAFLDANPGKYKTHNVLSDGYSPSGEIENLLLQPVGTQPNPAKVPQVPVAVTFAALAQAAPTTLAALPDADIAPIQAKIDGQDNAGLANWAVLLGLRKVMPDPEKAAVLALCQATQPDPSFPATVPGPSDLLANFGASVMPPNDHVFSTDGKNTLLSYQSFVDKAIGRAGTVLS